MTQYDKTNRGTLFKNNRKGSEKHADYTGKLNVAGVDYWISAWLKDGKIGKFMSLSVKEQDGNGDVAKAKAASAQPRGRSDLDDDIPFLPER